MFKRLFALLTLFVFFISTVSSASEDFLPDFFNFDNDDEVTIIVELEKDVAEVSVFKVYGKNALLKEQELVMASINSEISPSLKKKFVYTQLINGFSMDAKKSDIGKIEEIPGVKKVYVAQTTAIPTPLLSTSEILSGINQLEDMGFSGEGTAIAIIDGFLDITHSFFDCELKNPKFTKEYIYSMVESGLLNALKNNKIYKSSKIPFAYNYENSTSDVYNSDIYHGTHVSGIASGCLATTPDGETEFSGVAPSSQLIFMNCANSSGGLNDATILAAMEDAVLLGVDVINMSLGFTKYDSDTKLLIDTAISNARGKGICVFAAAGNDGRGYNFTPQPIENIDYSTTSSPASYESTTAVGSVKNIDTEDGGNPSWFSSWGVDSALELKPEITAPGENIYSSVPDGGFSSGSGTSMATPHASGISLLALEYYKSSPFIDSFNNLTGAEKVNLIENIMMNSATILNQENDVPYSPRLQGAGLVNAAEMIKSKVLLTGNSGKAKVSLGELSEPAFDVSFKITNITEEEITFDNISLELLTDGYAAENGKNYISDSVLLPYDSIKAPEAITLLPGEEYSFTANVELNEAFLEENKKIFTNGFFIDGFVILKSEEINYKASLPFTGFYGNWYDSPIFDSTIYDEGSSTLRSPYTDAEKYRENIFNTGTFIAVGNDSGYTIAGRNPLLQQTLTADYRYIAYSPLSKHDVFLSYKMHRPTILRTCYVYNSDGDEVYKKVDAKVKKQRHAQDKMKLDLISANLNEGSYTLKFTANYITSPTANDSIEIPIFVDRTPPQLKNVSYNYDTSMLTLTASDNHYICAFIVEYTNKDGKRVTASLPITPKGNTGGTVTARIELKEAAASPNAVVSCSDYARNMITHSIKYYTEKAGHLVSEIQITKDFTFVKLFVRNNTSSPISKDVILGFYDSEGKLLTALKQPVSLLSGDEKSLSFSSLKDITEAADLSVFIWDNALQPFTKATSYILK